MTSERNCLKGAEASKAQMPQRRRSLKGANASKAHKANDRNSKGRRTSGLRAPSSFHSTLGSAFDMARAITPSPFAESRASRLGKRVLWFILLQLPIGALSSYLAWV